MDDLGDFKRYKIGEAAKLVGVKPYVLRFWETEFPELDPVRTSSGQRLYTDEHLTLVRDIKGLLYGEGLTIEGARKRLMGQHGGQPNGQMGGPAGVQAGGPAVDQAGGQGRGAHVDTGLLRDIHDELTAILDLLDGRESGEGA